MSRFYSHNILPCKTKETSHFYRKLYLIADAELKYFWTKIKCWERKMLTTLFSGRSVCLMTAKHEKVSFWFLIFATKTRNFSNWRWFMASPNKVTVKLVTNHFVVLLPIWVAEAESPTTSVSTRMFSIKKCSLAPTKEMWALGSQLFWHCDTVLSQYNIHLYLSLCMLWLHIFTTSRGSESGFSWYLSLCSQCRDGNRLFYLSVT